MYCPNCGKEIDDTSNFCLYCGKKIKMTKNKYEDIKRPVQSAAIDKKENAEKAHKRKRLLSILFVVFLLIIITNLIIMGIIGYFNNDNKTENSYPNGPAGISYTHYGIQDETLRNGIGTTLLVFAIIAGIGLICTTVITFILTMEENKE